MTTRADVAKLAGVSASTVSYALSGVRSIKPETRERVLRAITELNYHPHFAAGVLAGGKAKALALHYPGGKHGIASSVLEYLTGAANASRERGYHLILWLNEDTQMNEIEIFCKSGLIGGVLLMEIRLEDDRANFLAEAGVPCTLIGRTNKPDLFKYVDRDFELVSQMAIDYLFQLGHRQIAFMNKKRKYKGVKVSVDTRFQSALVKYSKKIGVKATELLVLNEAASGRDAFIELRDKHPNVSALIGVNDLATIGFINAANEFGVNIPDELSVISLNTPDNQVQMAWPLLTTISVPANQMGRAAADILIDQLEGITGSNIQQLWVGDLIVRGTTAPARN